MVSYLLKCAMWLWKVKLSTNEAKVLENLYLCNLHKIKVDTYLIQLSWRIHATPRRI